MVDEVSNSERVNKAIKEVGEKLLKMDKEEFYKLLDKHRDGDISRCLKELEGFTRGRA